MYFIPEYFEELDSKNVSLIRTNNPADSLLAQTIY